MLLYPADEPARPAYLSIAERLRVDLLAGRWKAGTSLPSTRELEHDAGWTKDTVAQAYRILAAEGLIELRERSRPIARSPGAIRDARSATLRNEVCRFAAHLRSLGYTDSEIHAALVPLEMMCDA